ncbi:MAG TPA: glycosyltransferase family 39 protein [Tepidisphaeraceae bacterium]|nr:glycosyltransferase family 39 protein [Tepidisphaeraceae bacterium]
MEASEDRKIPLNWLLMLAATAGIVCRVAQYAAHQSMWIDEASLALNIRNHTAAGLFGPLDYDQAAPPLFLLAERALYLTFGGSEISLRFVPLICGIASVVIFALLARRMLEPPWDAIATAAFALSDRLIWHSCEVKQYGVDATVAVLLIYLAIGPRADGSATRRFIAAAAVATVAAWFSYTAMLVFPAIAIALFPRRDKGTAVAPFLAGCALAGTSFLLIVQHVVAAQQTQSLSTTWQGDFIDLRHFWRVPWWLVRHLHSMSNYAIPGAGTVALIGSLAGAIWLWRSGKREELLILGGPILVALGAAAAHRYPFDGSRLTCFLCGPDLMLAIIGLRWIYGGMTRFGRPVSAAPAALVLGFAMVPAAMHLVVPRDRGHLRQAVKFIREHVQPDDEIYVLHDQRIVLWYWPACEGRMRWRLGPDDPPPGRRFWIVWNFDNDASKRRAEAVVRWADGFATRRQQIHFSDCGAVLMERQTDGM